MVHTSLSEIWKASQKSKYVSQHIIQDYRRWVRMIFGFNLYVTSLLAVLVIYFRSRLGELNGSKLQKGGKMCHH